MALLGKSLSAKKPVVPAAEARPRRPDLATWQR